MKQVIASILSHLPQDEALEGKILEIYWDPGRFPEDAIPRTSLVLPTSRQALAKYLAYLACDSLGADVWEYYLFSEKVTLKVQATPKEEWFDGVPHEGVISVNFFVPVVEVIDTSTIARMKKMERSLRDLQVIA